MQSIKFLPEEHYNPCYIELELKLFVTQSLTGNTYSFSCTKPYKYLQGAVIMKLTNSPWLLLCMFVPFSLVVHYSKLFYRPREKKRTLNPLLESELHFTDMRVILPSTYNLQFQESITRKPVHFYRLCSLAKQQDNALGSVRPSVCSRSPRVPTHMSWQNSLTFPDFLRRIFPDFPWPRHSCLYPNEAVWR